MKASATQCPRHATPRDYLRHVELARAAGLENIAPTTIAQIEALIERYPHLGRQYIPAKEHRDRMGLPESWGQDPEPFDSEWRQRFFATLDADPEFCRAVALKLEAAR